MKDISEKLSVSEAAIYSCLKFTRIFWGFPHARRCSAVLDPKARVFGHTFGKDCCEFYNLYACDCGYRDKTILSNGPSMTTIQAFKLAKKNRENANAAIR